MPPCLSKYRCSCSCNAVNGVPSCANDWLLRDKLRGEWQFNGCITSDCDADSDVFYSRNYITSSEEALADVLRYVCLFRSTVPFRLMARCQGRHRRRLR